MGVPDLSHHQSDPDAGGGRRILSAGRKTGSEGRTVSDKKIKADYIIHIIKAAAGSMSLIKRDMEPAAFILHYSSSDDLLQMGYAPEHSPDTKHYFQPDIPGIFAEHLHQFPVAAESYFSAQRI